MDRLTLNYVWNQKETPVVLRRTGKGERLRVRLPFADTPFTQSENWEQNAYIDRFGHGRIVIMMNG